MPAQPSGGRQNRHPQIPEDLHRQPAGASSNCWSIAVKRQGFAARRSVMIQQLHQGASTTAAPVIKECTQAATTRWSITPNGPSLPSGSRARTRAPGRQMHEGVRAAPSVNHPITRRSGQAVAEPAVRLTLTPFHLDDTARAC
jgi:hypothetical protein